MVTSHLSTQHWKNKNSDHCGAQNGVMANVFDLRARGLAPRAFGLETRQGGLLGNLPLEFLGFEVSPRSIILGSRGLIVLETSPKSIGHFRITFSLFLKASLGAHLSYENEILFTCKLNSFSYE